MSKSLAVTIEFEHLRSSDQYAAGCVRLSRRDFLLVLGVADAVVEIQVVKFSRTTMPNKNDNTKEKSVAGYLSADFATQRD